MANTACFFKVVGIDAGFGIGTGKDFVHPMTGGTVCDRFITCFGFQAVIAVDKGHLRYLFHLVFLGQDSN